MKFVCEKDEIIKEISAANEIVETKNALSIMANVYLEAADNELTIRATDLKVGAEVKIPVEMEEPGSLTAPCNKLLVILKSLPAGRIVFAREADRLTIKLEFKSIDFSLKLIEAEKYPEILEPPEGGFFEVPQKDWVEMIANTHFAVCTDVSRYFLGGAFVERKDGKLNMVATDGRRLSFASKAANGEDQDGVIVPTKILNMLRKLLPGEGNLSIAATGRQIFVHYGGYQFYSNLVEGQFPNYHRVIPETQEYRLIVAREELERAVRRVALVTEQKSLRVHLKLSENKIAVTSEANEIGTGSEELACEYSGPENSIAFNCHYLTEPLREMDSEKVSLEYTDPNKAVTVRAVPEKDYFHIFMPMNVE